MAIIAILIFLALITIIHSTPIVICPG